MESIILIPEALCYWLVSLITDMETKIFVVKNNFWSQGIPSSSMWLAESSSRALFQWTWNYVTNLAKSTSHFLGTVICISGAKFEFLVFEKGWILGTQAYHEALSLDKFSKHPTAQWPCPRSSVRWHQQLFTVMETARKYSQWCHIYISVVELTNGFAYHRVCTYLHLCERCIRQA